MSNEYTPEFIPKLLDKIDTLTTLIVEQTTTITKLTETISKQQDEIKILREQLNKNSKNSSNSPSSDGFNKPDSKNPRKNSGKK